MQVTWQTFSEEQKTAAKVLKHALERDELAHAYLMEGPKGTGKAQAAVLLAQTLLCGNKRNGEPCYSCRNCRRVVSGNHPDVIRIRPEEGSSTIKKEQIAFLMKEFSYRSVESGRKIYIIEEAEKMTVQAENSLLKFIEEPHPGTLAVLLTDHVHQLLDTIISRCQVLTFMPLSRKDVETRLIEEGAQSGLATIAAALTNDYSEAAALCKNEWFAKARSLVLQLVEGLLRSPESALPILYEQFTPNFDNNQKIEIGLDLLLLWYRDVMSVHLDRKESVVYGDELGRIREQALQLSLRQAVRMMAVILDAKKRLDAHVNGISVMEQLIIRLGGSIAS